MVEVFAKTGKESLNEDDKRLKVYMLYDRVMKNIQNRHKLIKHTNSFINARLQRKLRKFAENSLSGSRVPSPTYELGTWRRVLGPTFRAPGLESWVPPMKWVPGLGFRVSPKFPGLGSHFLDMSKCQGKNVNFSRTKSIFHNL